MYRQEKQRLSIVAYLFIYLFIYWLASAITLQGCNADVSDVHM